MRRPPRTSCPASRRLAKLDSRRSIWNSINDHFSGRVLSPSLLSRCFLYSPEARDVNLSLDLMHSHVWGYREKGSIDPANWKFPRMVPVVWRQKSKFGFYIQENSAQMPRMRHLLIDVTFTYPYTKVRYESAQKTLVKVWANKILAFGSTRYHRI